MTIRERIVSALVARLKTLTTANGYASNAGSNVYWWYPESLQVEAIPTLVIRDAGDSITPSGRNLCEHSLRIEVNGFISDGVNTAGACQDLIGDIVAVVMDPEDRTLSDVCDTLTFTDGGSIQLDQQTDKTVGSVSLALSATYKTDRGNWSTRP